MHVDEDGVAGLSQWAVLQHLVHSRERIVQDGLHVALAQQVGHQHAPPVVELVEMRAAAGRIGKPRIVERPDQPGFAHDVGERLALVPGVVSKRQAVRPRGEQFTRRGFGDPEPAGGVLGVDHHELQPEPPSQARQMFADPLAARTADHVAKEPDTHACRPYQDAI